VLFEAPTAFNKANSTLAFGITVGNIGKTPTRNLIYDGECSFNENDILSFFQKKESELQRTANLAERGNDFWQSYKCALNKGGITLMQQNRPFFVYGWAKYQDALGGGDRSYETQFCRVYIGVVMDAKMQIAGRAFNRCPKHNCVDEDCAGSR
jgi:hypothetical protein